MINIETNKLLLCNDTTKDMPLVLKCNNKYIRTKYQMIKWKIINNTT